MDRFGLNKATSFLLSLLIMVGTCNVATAVSFEPIDVPNRFGNNIPPYAAPNDLSPDGSRAVGTIVEPGVIYDCGSLAHWGCWSGGFVWTPSAGLSTGDIQGFPQNVETFRGVEVVYPSLVLATSDSAVLAHAEIRIDIFPNAQTYIGPMLLTQAGPIFLAEGREDGGRMTARSISDDGSIVVGSINFFDHSEGFRWTPDQGFEEFGNSDERLTGVSGNGKVIVGSQTPNSFRHDSINAFRWTESESFIPLPNTPDGRGIGPNAVSYDGSTIVGVGWLDGTGQPLVWNQQSGTNVLSVLPGFSSGSASDLSANGVVIIGNVWTQEKIVVALGDEDFGTTRAVLWDENRQVHDLQEWLINSYDLDDQLFGWSLTSASAISANGQVIAGVGVNPAGDLQGWVVTIPEPSSRVLSVGFCIVVLLIRKRRPLAA